jgi:hypothetical protein
MADLNRLLTENLALVLGVLALFVLLLLVLVAIQSVRLGRAVRAYRRLLGSGGTDGKSLEGMISEHVARVDGVTSRLGELQSLHEFLETRSRGSLQHIGMVRFNPFEDTGSDQSFAIALLDDRRDGIVLSSLHGRTYTRIFAKPVEAGSSRHALSDEETEAIRIAVEGTRAPPVSA